MGIVPPKGLLGQWSDSYGNTVVVRATDASGSIMMATLSRPPRHDIHLRFRPLDAGAGWLCGDATLAATIGPSSLPSELYWAFSDGKASVWVRKQPVPDNGQSIAKAGVAPTQNTESTASMESKASTTRQDSEGQTPVASGT